jgi:hypothetical protein
MLARLLAATFLGGLALTGALSAQTNPAGGRDRAHVIFDATRAAVSRLASPPYVAFTLQDAGYSDNSKSAEQLRVLVRASDGAAVVIALADPNGVEIAHPSPRVILGPSYGSLSYISRLGDFTLYDFSLRYDTPKRPGLFDAPGTPEPEATPEVKTLAVVRAYNPGYIIADLGDTTLDGLDVFHLGFTPIRDPGHHVLREMWIDKASSLPLRYLTEIPVNYPSDAGQVVQHEATVDTALLDGHLTNTEVNGRFRIRVGEVDTDGVVKWSVSEVSFPVDVPDWAFDLAQWKNHIGEAIPGLAPNENDRATE